MANNLPEQPHNTNKFYGFSNAVIWYMKEKGMTQSELVESSRLSKTTISRIVRNNNDKGSSYQPTPPVIMAVGIGLKLTYREYEELIYAAYPEMEYMKEHF